MKDKKDRLKRTFRRLTILLGVPFMLTLLLMINIIDIPAIKSLHNFLLNHYKVSMYILCGLGILYFISMFIFLKYESVNANARLKELNEDIKRQSNTFSNLDKKISAAQNKLINAKSEVNFEIKSLNVEVKCAARNFQKDYNHVLEEVVYANKHLYRVSQKTELANNEELQTAFKEYESSLKWL